MLQRCVNMLLMLLPIAGVAQITNYEVGEVVPDFTGIEIDGTEHNLYEYTAAGKYVLIDFFAYWCGPCVATAPKIQEFYEKYGCNSGSVIVLGNECDAGGTNDHLEAFNESAGLDPLTSYPSWSGMEGNGADICNMYGPAAYPTVALIGPDNKLLHNDIWPIPNIGAIEDAFPPGVLMPKACEVVTAINEQDLSSLAVIAPNQASERVTITWQSATSGTIQFLLFNQMGQLLLTREAQQFSGSDNTLLLEVDQLPEGIYMLEARTADHQTWYKTLQVMR